MKAWRSVVWVAQLTQTTTDKPSVKIWLYLMEDRIQWIYTIVTLLCLCHSTGGMGMSDKPQQHRCHHRACEGRKGHQDRGTAAPRGHAVLGYQWAPTAHTHITDWPLTQPGLLGSLCLSSAVGTALTPLRLLDLQGEALTGRRGGELLNWDQLPEEASCLDRRKPQTASSANVFSHGPASPGSGMLGKTCEPTLICLLWI